jgi:(p)ppGpp synthase/HD superfamily hydrolase
MGQSQYVVQLDRHFSGLNVRDDTCSKTTSTKRFNAALCFTADLHRSQFRKNTKVPYVGHLLTVASLVIEDGGSEDEAIAALLHDSIEDQP